ncbi:Protein of unknown function [Escherichia coli D6-113.11]|nr:Protein of unknown function [Escherichia coli D6-113.11]CDU34650.1 Protein of unknown function [Escherichia coli D6-113.11]
MNYCEQARSNLSQ